MMLAILWKYLAVFPRQNHSWEFCCLLHSLREQPSFSRHSGRERRRTAVLAGYLLHGSDNPEVSAAAPNQNARRQNVVCLPKKALSLSIRWKLWTSGNFQWRMERQFRNFWKIERKTALRGFRKFITESYRSIWLFFLNFRSFQQFSDFLETFAGNVHTICHCF